MKSFYCLLLATVFSLLYANNDLLGQTSTTPAPPTAGQVMKQYQQRTQKDLDNMQQQINVGLGTMRQTLNQAQVTYDGRVILANDTLDVVTPMQSMAEGLLKAAEGMNISSDDLGGVRTAISTMPFLLKGGLDMLKTMLPEAEGQKK